MSDRPSRLLDLLAEHTASTPEEVDALRRAVARRTADARVSRALLRNVLPPTAGEIAVLRQRMEGAARSRPRSRWALPLAAFGGGMVAVATAGGLLLAAAVGAWLTAQPVPDRTVALDLSADARAPVREVGPRVRLRPDGTGTVSGTERAPRIAWTAGTVAIEVDPGHGVDLTVATREAEVRVVGTVFAVTRDALGTRVRVQRGRVAVTCLAGGSRILDAGQSATCLPTTAPGLLGRANELKRGGAPPEEVLATVEIALPSAGGPFLAELLALQAESLLALGRHDEARAAADRYLQSGGPRAEEVLQIAANAALASGGCPAALRYLQELEERGAGDPELLSRCEDGG